MVPRNFASFRCLALNVTLLVPDAPSGLNHHQPVPDLRRQPSCVPVNRSKAMARQDRGPELAVITAACLGFASLAVFLRCYVRLFVLKAFRTEDWLAVATLLCFASYATFVMLSIQYGAGKHTDAVSLPDVVQAIKFRWAGELAYVVTSVFLKFTIGIFLLRICSRAWQKAVIWIVLVACLVFNLFYCFIAAFQCNPVDYYWMAYEGAEDGKCLSKTIITSSTYSASGINACADWVLGLLPIALVWNLDLGKRQKMSVAGILALGSIASAATIARIPYICKLVSNKEQTLYEFTDLAIWSTIENGLGLTASSMATLKPLFQTFFGIAKRRSLGRWPSHRRAGSGSLKFECRGPSDDDIVYLRMPDYPPSPRSALFFKDEPEPPSPSIPRSPPQSLPRTPPPPRSPPIPPEFNAQQVRRSPQSWQGCWQTPPPAGPGGPKRAQSLQNTRHHAKTHARSPTSTSSKSVGTAGKSADARHYSDRDYPLSPAAQRYYRDCL
ncbi:hypothetical protein GGR56DRAFT_268245 [Xylariaceae sp. FL0804]|nr:hypothetical protein GGR56DRAFT_268245 [Xylariaceae sp. FL0804]